MHNDLTRCPAQGNRKKDLYTNVHQWTKLIKLKLSNHYNVCTIQHEY